VAGWVQAGPAQAADGMALLCNRGDYSCVAGTGYRGQSYWGANYGKTGHNCTSYVSYRLAMAGAAEPWHTMGNANQWDERGRGKVPVDDIPTVGSVAQWEGGTRLAPGDRGHVGFVEAVTTTGIEITDDTSSGGTRRYTIRRGSPYWPDNFIHIHDAPKPPSLQEGRFTLATRNAVDALEAGTVGPELRFGEPGSLPVTGDWDGDGDDTVGTFSDGAWVLTNATTGTGKQVRVQFGEPGDLPVAGDWDGDGDDTIGVFRDGRWLLADSLGRHPKVDRELSLGAKGDIPVVGDWDGNGVDAVGVFRDGLWVLSNGFRATMLPSMAVSYGAAGDVPVVGNWDGKRGDSIGLYRDGTWRLSNQNTNVPDKVLTVKLGGPGDLPITGAWDGKRTRVGIAS
jgi:surface antigen